MQNVVQVWLYLIGTSDRAERLIENLWRLEGRYHRGCGGPVEDWECTSCNKRLPRAVIRTTHPLPDPVAILDGIEMARWLYAQQELTSAFDAWDTQQLTARDMRYFAEWIRDGHYTGPVFDPVSALKQQTAERASLAAGPSALLRGFGVNGSICQLSHLLRKLLNRAL